MNSVKISGIVTDVQYSHLIQDKSFYSIRVEACTEESTKDQILVKFKAQEKPELEGKHITLEGSIRSYSYRVSETQNRVQLYVSTYEDCIQPSDEFINEVCVDGRICKISDLYVPRKGECSIHFILANNIPVKDSRINSYIPCVARGDIARIISECKVNTQLVLRGVLHSREHTLKSDEESVRLVHELVVTDVEVVS